MTRSRWLVILCLVLVGGQVFLGSALVEATWVPFGNLPVAGISDYDIGQPILQDFWVD
jgi:hypothetical protein